MFTRKFHAAMALGALAVFFSMGVQAESAAVLAKIASSEVISQADYDAYVERRIDLKALKRSYWGVKQIVEEMATTRALVLEGQRIGEKRPERPDGAELRFDDMYGEAVYQKIADKCNSKMTEEEAKKYYVDHPAAFLVPPEAKLRRIVLPINEKVEDVLAADWLMQQARKIVTGAQKIDETARIAQEIYKLEAQGDIGWVPLSSDFGVMKVLSSAQSGELVGPVREGDFVYLFEITAKKPEKKLQWDVVSNFAATRAYQYCSEESRKKIRNELFERYAVIIEDAEIRGMFKDVPVKK